MCSHSLVAVRLATHAETGVIPGVELAATGIFDNEDLPLAVRHRTTSISDLHAGVSDSRLWVAATTENKIVGFSLAATLDGSAYLAEVGVLPSFMRLGIGSRLVTAVVDWARCAGFDDVVLVTFRHLDWNAPFYARFGFIELPQNEIGPELACLMGEEEALGLDPCKRAAMRMQLIPDA